MHSHCSNVSNRAFFRVSPLLVPALLLVGCATGGPGNTIPIEEMEFAPSLELNLDQMTRSSSGLYFLDLRLGTGEEARRTDRVTVHYAGWFPDGRLFESSREAGQVVAFTIGNREVIRAWEEGVRGMRVGGKRKLIVPPRLAYGSRGVENVIPRDATLVFEVELLAVNGTSNESEYPSFH